MSSDVCMPPTSTEGPDVQTDRKTPKQICLCVVEKLNMIFLVFFICYLSWSIPANYGLFTSKSSNVSMSYSSATVQTDDINSTEEIVDGWVLLNSSDFSSTFLNNEEDFSFHKISYRKERKHNKWKNRKNKKKKKNDKGSKTMKQKNKNKKRRKNKKCKNCKERKKMRTKFRENMLKLEPTAIRQIIERVAEEALQKGAGSMDFGVNYNPFTLSKDALSQWSSWSQCSVTCNSGRMSRSRTCGLSCRETESMVCYMPSCKRENKKKKEEHFSLDFDRFIPPLPTEEYINEDVDTCEEWIGCNNQTIKVYLNTSNLPSCPCYYPLHLSYNNKVWDRYKQKHFRWQDILFEEESVNAFKPKAHYCIRSKLYKGTKTLAAQSCCYDDTMRLITRGKSAGTPNLISPEISPELHQKLDINPWVICKGDWTRYNEVIAPNNELNCRPNPNEKELDIQIHQAQNY